MPEFITGYEELKKTTWDKITPLMDDWMLATLKLQQLRAQGNSPEQETALLAIIGKTTEQIQEIFNP